MMKKLLIAIISIFCILSIMLSLLYFVPYPRYINFNKEVIQSDEFLPYPDSVVCRIGGKTEYLNDQQIAALYADFQVLMSDFRTLSGLFNGAYNPFKRMKFHLENTCVEFRYKQRHKYIGCLFSEQEYTGETSYQSFEYDAVLMIFWSDSLIFFPYLNMSYYSVQTNYPCLIFYNGTGGFLKKLESL